MSGPVKSFLRTAALSLLTIAPPPRVSGLLRSGRFLSPRDRGGSRASAAPGSAQGGQHKVVVLGGGFGGLYTALRLNQLATDAQAAGSGGGGGGRRGAPNPPPLDITVVDCKEQFVFLPLLYELAVGTASEAEVAPPLASLLEGTGIKFVQGTATDVVLPPGEPAGAAGTTAGGGQGGGGSVRVRLASGATGGAVDEATREGAEEVEQVAAAAAATGEEAEAGVVSLPYDRLVVALGSEVAAAGLDRVPGAREHAVPFYTVEDAHRLGDAIAALEARPQAQGAQKQEARHVVVVGGGYSGVELACNLAERLPRCELTLLHAGAELLPASGDGARRRASAALARNGVTVRCGARVAAVGPASLTTMGPAAAAGAADDPAPSDPVAAASAAGDGGWEQPADLVVWTAGSKPHSSLRFSTRDDTAAAAAAAVVTEEGTGRLAVSPTLAVRLSSPPLPMSAAAAPSASSASAAVFALGDMAATSPSPLPPTAQVAFQQSEYCAWNVWASVKGERALAFRYTPLGEMLTLGEADAAVSGPPTTTAGGEGGEGGGGAPLLELGGPLGALARRVVYAARMPTPGQRQAAIEGLFQRATTMATAKATAKAAGGETGGAGALFDRWVRKQAQ